MTSAEKIVYDTTDAEASAPLNEQAQVLNPPESKESRCTPTKYKIFTVGALAVALAAGGVGYYFGAVKNASSRPKYSYKRVAVSNTTSSDVQPLLLSSNNQECTVSQGSESSQVNIVPMPHQIILCQDQNYCQGSYVVVSLYDYNAYISDAQTLLLYDWSSQGFQDSNIHSYSQGKYVQSMFQETKVEQTDEQQLLSAVASYAISSIVGDACAALQTAADGIPVCKIVNFVASITGDFWDLGQNTPSSQSGEWSTNFQHVGLGGNINVAYVQFYDPYNYPAATFFEYGSCTEESLTYGSRQFSVTGTSANPVLNQMNQTTFNDISYPALNADSVLLPFNTWVNLYQNDKLVQQISNDCPDPANCEQYECFEINGLFNTIEVGYASVQAEGVSDTTWMLQNYESCLNNPGYTEQWCAAQDKCLEENNWNWDSCPDSVVPNYENPAWVSGNCGNS